MIFEKVEVDGTTTYTQKMTLEEMQAFVDGYIEISGPFIVNEEGLLRGMEPNAKYPQFVGNVIRKQRRKA